MFNFLTVVQGIFMIGSEDHAKTIRYFNEGMIELRTYIKPVIVCL